MHVNKICHENQTKSKSKTSDTDFTTEHKFSVTGRVLNFYHLMASRVLLSVQLPRGQKACAHDIRLSRVTVDCLKLLFRTFSAGLDVLR